MWERGFTSVHVAPCLVCLCAHVCSRVCIQTHVFLLNHLSTSPLVPQQVSPKNRHSPACSSHLGSLRLTAVPLSLSLCCLGWQNSSHLCHWWDWTAVIIHVHVSWFQVEELSLQLGWSKCHPLCPAKWASTGNLQVTSSLGLFPRPSECDSAFDRIPGWFLCLLSSEKTIPQYIS